MRHSSPFLLAVIGSLLVVVVGLSYALLKYPPYAPAINSEQRSDRGLKAHQGADENRGASNNTSAEAPRIVSEGGCGKCQPETERSEDEGTEFWPSFHGYRLKITDTLVAAFTALLFFATIALWLATRSLVKGAEGNCRAAIARICDDQGCYSQESYRRRRAGSYHYLRKLGSNSGFRDDSLGAAGISSISIT
jgi:hypothetical protein